MLEALLASLGLDGGAASGALLETVALRADPSEVLALAALAQTPSSIADEIGTLGRYTLVGKIACSPPDECFEAEHEERRVFLRTFPRERLTDALIAELKRWPQLDYGVVDHQPYVVSEYVEGIDLRGLRDLRPSLPSVLALLAEGMAALGAIHVESVHGHLSRGRIRIEPSGSVQLCLGRSEPSGPSRAGEDLCTLAQLMLETAIEDPDLAAILASGDAEALVVASDRLIELNPSLDELIAAVLVEQSRPDSVLPLLLPHLPADDALSLIRRIVESNR